MSSVCARACLRACVCIRSQPSLRREAGGDQQLVDVAAAKGAGDVLRGEERFLEDIQAEGPAPLQHGVPSSRTGGAKENVKNRLKNTLAILHSFSKKTTPKHMYM